MSNRITNKTEIRITNVRESLKDELYYIARSHEMELGPFLRKKLKEIADSYPPEKKKAQDDY